MSNIKSTKSTQYWSIFNLELLDIRPSFLLFRATGKKVKKAFEHEAGGHRFQRVPPTEKRGRTQTSTVTVAVLEEPKSHEVQINPKDLEEHFTRGSGAGGQHRNKTDTAVVLKHKPSGITVRIDGGRSQHTNRETALEVLRARLNAQKDELVIGRRNEKRRRQVGCGARGDKIRTIALQRDCVTDHQTGKTMSAKKYTRGYLSELWS